MGRDLADAAVVEVDVLHLEPETSARRVYLRAAIAVLAAMVAWYFAWVRPHDDAVGELLACLDRAHQAHPELDEPEVVAICVAATR